MRLPIRGTGVVVALLALLGASLAPATFAQQQAPVEGITVYGQGVVNVVPDVAQLNVGVQTTASSAQQAVEENDAAMQRVIDAVTAQGIDPADVQTFGISVYPQFGPPNLDGTQSPATYQASNSVSVRVRDIGRVGLVLDAAFGAGANISGGVSFGLLDDAPARREALNLALADARAKAEAIASGLGKQLGDVVAVSEEFGTPVPLPAGSKLEGMGAGTPVQPGNIQVVGSVRITYQMR